METTTGCGRVMGQNEKCGDEWPDGLLLCNPCLEVKRLQDRLAQAERENEKLQHDIHQYVQIASDLVAERDEARGLLREAHSRIRYDEGEDDLLYVKIDAHLRDTGE